MLALPITTAQIGFLGSLVLLFVCWFVMTAGAFLILEVNLWMPASSNLNTMARDTIGPLGQVISWFSILLLLYSLLCAYIAGGSDLLHNLLLARNFDIPVWLSSIVFTIVFGSVVYLGIRSVDYVNRGLMVIKFGAYFLLIFLLMPFVTTDKLMAGDVKYMTSTAAIMITIASFGFAAIVPSLRIYFDSDVKKLKKAIWIGSLVPLVCYIAWDIAIMGVIPLAGEHGLVAILKSETATSDLVNTLNSTVASTSVAFSAKLFTSICVLTSFLGVSICLVDFLADGLQLEKKGKNNFILTFATFIPPLVIVLFFPNVFIKALEYAGIYCVVLLMLLPAWMAWRGRYHKHFSDHFTVPGGKPLLALLCVISVALIIKALFRL
jgi:tyrosine-specific transport protein